MTGRKMKHKEKLRLEYFHLLRCSEGFLSYALFLPRNNYAFIIILKILNFLVIQL